MCMIVFSFVLHHLSLYTLCAWHDILEIKFRVRVEWMPDRGLPSMSQEASSTVWVTTVFPTSFLGYEVIPGMWIGGLDSFMT